MFANKVYSDGADLRCSRCGCACQNHYSAKLQHEDFTRNDLCIGCYDLNQLRLDMADQFQEWMDDHQDIVQRWEDRHQEPTEQDLSEVW